MQISSRRECKGTDRKYGPPSNVNEMGSAAQQGVYMEVNNAVKALARVELVKLSPYGVKHVDENDVSHDLIVNRT